MTTENEAAEQSPNSRRRMLTGLAIGGSAVVGGVVGASAASAQSTGVSFVRESLSVDVACLGDFWRDVAIRNPANDADFRAPFSIEGIIYPEGTIPGSGFIPTEDGAIGRWFCRGWVVIDATRPEPHTISQQEFVFGEITPDDLFPPDTLATSGIEGTLTDQVNSRPVVGGTGKYLGATGQVRQYNNGDNTSVYADGTNDPAPNFIMEFDLIRPDI